MPQFRHTKHKMVNSDIHHIINLIVGKAFIFLITIQNKNNYTFTIKGIR